MRRVYEHRADDIEGYLQQFYAIMDAIEAAAGQTGMTDLERAVGDKFPLMPLYRWVAIRERDITIRVLRSTILSMLYVAADVLERIKKEQRRS